MTFLDRLLLRMRSVLGISPGAFDEWARRNRARLQRELGAVMRRTQRQEPTSGHLDVGEVIPEARKHTWVAGTRITPSNLDSVEETGRPFKLVIKANVFPELDVAEEKEAGSTPGAVWLKRKVIDAVAPGPGADASFMRKLYVDGAAWLLAELEKLHNVGQVLDFLGDWFEMSNGNYLLPEVYTAQDLVDKFGASETHGSVHFVYPYTPEQLKELRRAEDFIKLARAVKDQAKVIEQSSIAHRIEEQVRTRIAAADMERAGYSSHLKRLRGPEGTTLYQLYRRVPTDENVLGKQTMALTGLDPATVSSHKDLRKARLLRILEGTFFSHRDSSSFWTKDVPFARDLEAKSNWAPLEPKEKKQGEERGDTTVRWTRATTGQQRKGPPTDVPAEVTGQVMLDTFGFRGLQYGNWVEQGSRGKYLPLAYEAFTDYADILGQPRTFLTRDGALGLAFGARGTGQAAAHFEQGLQVINLTHSKGDGSFAHEWWHFLDSQMLEDPKAVKVLPGGRGVAAQASSSMVPKEFRDTQVIQRTAPLDPRLHPDVVDALRAMMTAIYVPTPDRRVELERERGRIRASLRARMDEMKAAGVKTDEQRDAYNALVYQYNNAPRKDQTTFSSDADKLGEYWSRPTELAARAFETWAEDKLSELKRVNTYLVFGTKLRYNLSRKWKEMQVDGLEPYPHGRERTDITRAVDNFVRVLAKHGLPGKSERMPQAKDMADFEARMRKRFPGLALDLHLYNGVITLSRIIAPVRNVGIGTSVMKELIELSDRNGYTVVLTPASDFGGSKARLVEFYKRLGFVENKGRNKDFSFRETMYRKPKMGRTS